MAKRKKTKLATQDLTTVTFESTALRSGRLPNTNRVALGFIQLIADRGDMGEEKYGKFNYRKGLLDREFVEQGFAHAVAHLQSVANFFHDNGTFPEGIDDELAGAAWGLMMLWEAREKHRNAVPA
jgi:hypothetical protein